ncbi:MAG: phosphoadenylyl-sulfate reductase [Pseudomonadota bacterium]
MATIIQNSPADFDPTRAERAREISRLNDIYENHAPLDILEHALQEPMFGDFCVVSSFGAESAVLLHMIATLAPTTPIVLIDTGKLFGETLRYCSQLQHRLGLEDVRHVHPKRVDIERLDPLGKLSGTAPDKCCQLRKSDVLERALVPFQSWINGRKRFQTDQRSLLSIVEADGERLKLTPLANWSSKDLAEYHKKHELPDHPLLSKGYGSIGCFPCTSKVDMGDDPRSGRWNGIDKTECGIHT